MQLNDFTKYLKTIKTQTNKLIKAINDNYFGDDLSEEIIEYIDVLIASSKEIINQIKR